MSELEVARFLKHARHAEVCRRAITALDHTWASRPTRPPRMSELEVARFLKHARHGEVCRRAIAAFDQHLGIAAQEAPAHV
jgi:hypothetical protein